MNPPIEYYTPGSGGAVATATMQTARELIGRGHRVTVLTIVDGEEPYPVGEVVPIRAETPGSLGFIRRRVSGLLWRLWRWDWPHYEYYLRSCMRALASLSPGPDAIVLWNDLMAPRHLRRRHPGVGIHIWVANEQRTNQRNTARLVRVTDSFIGVSGFIRDWTKRTYGVPDEKLAVVRPGVDLDSFRPRPGFLEPRTPVQVLFIGRIDPNKGPDLAVEAIALARARGLDVELTVVGAIWWYGHENQDRDPYFRNLKARMDAVGVNYLGHVDRSRVAEIVRSQDISCVPSRANEPFGMVVLEAMASGLAVIASRRGGLPEACAGAGILIDPDRPADLASALGRLVADPGELRRHKAACHERASRASWALTAQELEEVIENHRPSA